MNILPIIAAAEEELCDIFEMLHAHPEIGFEEHKTSQIVAERLRAFGVDEVHTGIGNTGVVGLLHGKGRGNRRIGLRADMDALPIHENTGLSYQSTQSGKMHACGHDGHTTMLLGAAKHLAETRDFDGSVALIFQPAEEGLGGALAMMEQGLFQKFPCDEIYGMHNAPNGRPGRFEICKGRAMAGAAFFDIVISGLGSHAALPHQSRDPIVIASGLVSQIQSIVSRNVAPLETAFYRSPKSMPVARIMSCLKRRLWQAQSVTLNKRFMRQPPSVCSRYATVLLRPLTLMWRWSCVRCSTCWKMIPICRRPIWRPPLILLVLKMCQHRLRPIRPLRILLICCKWCRVPIVVLGTVAPCLCTTRNLL